MPSNKVPAKKVTGPHGKPGGTSNSIHKHHGAGTGSVQMKGDSAPQKKRKTATAPNNPGKVSP